MTFVKVLLGILVAGVLAVGTLVAMPPRNPDPNHAHADFAVWIDGRQLDFSGPEYMSAPPAESASWFIDSVFAHGDEEDEHVVPGREYLHLHNGVGHVIHRHKPGLTLRDFFTSLSIQTAKMVELDKGRESNVDEMAIPSMNVPRVKVFVYVNGISASQSEGLDYIFEDADRILITTSVDAAELQKEWSSMTSDACLYSKTCPWRGTPPTEGCVADPTVPCTE